ncbi:MAG: peptide-N-glycosidase F-related protein [Bacteroidia bacterium]
MNNKSYSKFILILSLFLSLMLLNNCANAGVGDTTIVQTFRFDTSMRAGVFMFPTDTAKTYEKIIMLYSMRCKNGLISNSGNTNLGCGEWDYNCYTYLVDSAQTDSLDAYHKSYDISNFTDTVFNYTTNPVYAYIQYNQQAVTYTSIISEDSAIVGTGTTSVINPLATSGALSRTQYLWTVAELSAAGLTAGNITGLRMDVLSLGSAVNNLRIKFKSIVKTVLDPDSTDLNGFTEVYFLNTTLATTGINNFNFFTPFNWDGTSNVLVDFSYTNALNGNDNPVQGHDAGFNAALINTQPDAYLNFNGGVQAVKVNPAAYSSISDQITVAFWAYGDSMRLPANTAIMEGNDNNNQRQLNIHLPWSDSNIYWDCGNDGSGYDRINKAAVDSEIAGRWNFWAFTKNAVTGVMHIYLNGNVWATGAGKTKLINIQNMIAGMSLGGITGYYGNFDELSIWNKELSSASIQQIMFKDITAAHPDYVNLLVYYKFNEATGMTAFDSSLNGYNSDLINPGWRTSRGNELFRNFTVSTFRPNTTFVQGVYTTSVQNFTVLDSVPLSANSVVSYVVTNNELSVIDTIYVWEAGYAYIYDPLGTVIDSVQVPSQATINITQLEYYSKRPMRLELINFITPYGINLNMNGLIGKTWEFDVTDYAPVLKGARFIAMEDGNHQEDNDIKFVFYEGTPPRDVKSISQIWPSGTWVSPSYNDIVNNKYFEPRDVILSLTANQFKVKSAISGHGQEGEFIPRNHTITLNGSVNYTRSVWKECATNPIYPQGGTWIYDRAGWCPGAVVDTREYEITSQVSGGQTINLDYSLPFIANPGSSNYRVNNQLVSYDSPNFSLDAAVNYIKTPSKRTEFFRKNPICNEPVISIKNTGSDTLISLDITYGRVGGAMSTYQWTGSLAFLDTVEITLPQPNWLTSLTNEFIAVVSNPNGGTDQYAENDTMYSAFDIPAVYPAQLIFLLKTNNLPSQNAYTLKDSQGNIIISRSGLAANTLYHDTVNLVTDCYTVYLTDAGDDGLGFWANPNQGSGYFQIHNIANGMVKNFNSDFGDNIYQQFTVNYALPVNELTDAAIHELAIYPNPASDIFVAEFSLPLQAHAEIKVMNMLGQQVISQPLTVTQDVEKVSIDISTLSEGSYYVSLETGTSKVTKKLMIIRN